MADFELVYLRQFLLVGRILGDGESGLDGILEGEVEGLGGEVSDAVSQVTSPEGDESLVSQCALCAVDDATVGTIQFALLDHFVLQEGILVMYKLMTS